jgi:hypothetical protein
MSNPSRPDASAVALARVDSPALGRVTLSKTFADNTAGVSDGNHPGSTTTLALTQLSLSVPGSTGQPVVDDVRWARHDGGALYVVDQDAGIVYRITGSFKAGRGHGDGGQGHGDGGRTTGERPGKARTARPGR